jgi:hypothetical protein
VARLILGNVRTIAGWEENTSTLLDGHRARLLAFPFCFGSSAGCSTRPSNTGDWIWLGECLDLPLLSVVVAHG